MSHTIVSVDQARASMMPATVDVSLWSRENGGARPRGAGSWAFAFDAASARAEAGAAAPWWARGLFSEARRAAEREARRRGVSWVWLLP